MDNGESFWGPWSDWATSDKECVCLPEGEPAHLMRSRSRTDDVGMTEVEFECPHCGEGILEWG